MSEEKEHCMIDGNRCFTCCQVIVLNETGKLRGWISYVRNHGYPKDFAGDNLFHRVTKISKRRAKKINPYLVKRVGNAMSYYTCSSFTGSGCGDYENRPETCSQFPYYGEKPSVWLSDIASFPTYRNDCTYHEAKKEAIE